MTVATFVSGSNIAAVVAVVIALLTFVSAQMGLLKKASLARVDAEHASLRELREEVDELKAELRACKAEVAERINENLHLMRKILNKQP